jgi:UDPglucose--hexose-1-phosphate uridylyltransferase
MEKAKIEKFYESNKFKEVTIGTVNWPMTVIRLTSNSKSRIVDAAMTIYEGWKEYSDESNEVLAFTGETSHNTVTPIARRNGELYEIDIVLRNNRTSEDYPEGIFHPHRELHHIKKENIVNSINNISDVSQEAASTREEVSASVEEQAAATEQMSALAKNLEGIIEELNKSISVFKV